MKGQILSYNTATLTGMISADDGKRYDFTVADYKSDRLSIQRGAQIEFVIDNAGAAKEIYLLGTAPQNDSEDISSEQLADFSGEKDADEATESVMEKMKNTVKKNKKSSAVIFSMVLAFVFYDQFYIPHVTEDEVYSIKQKKKEYCLDTPFGGAKYRLPDDFSEFVDDGMVHLRYKKNGNIDTGVYEGYVKFADGWDLAENSTQAYSLWKDGIRISEISYSAKSEFPRARVDFNPVDGDQFKKVTFFDSKGKVIKVIDYNGNKGESKTLYPSKRVKMIEHYTGYEQYPNKRTTFYDTGAKRCEYDFSSQMTCYYPNGNLNSEYKKGFNEYTGYFSTGEKKYFVGFSDVFAHQVAGRLEWERMQAETYPKHVVNEDQYKIIPCDQQLATGEAVIYDLPSGTPGTRTVGGVTCVDDDMGRLKNFVEWDINGNIVKKVGNTPEELEKEQKSFDEMMMRGNLGWSN